MNQVRVIDQKVLRHPFKKVPSTVWEGQGSSKHHLGGNEFFLGPYRSEIGEYEWFKYLIKVGISEGWNPQGDYYTEVDYKKNRWFCQTMVKYENYVTTNPPPPPMRILTVRNDEGVLFGIKKHKTVFFGNGTYQVQEEVEHKEFTYNPFYNLKTVTNYKNGEKHGLFVEFHFNGLLKLKQTGNYKNGKKDGLWEEFSDGDPPSGENIDSLLTKKINYKNGVIQSQEVFKKERKLGCFFYFCLFVGLGFFLVWFFDNYGW